MQTQLFAEHVPELRQGLALTQPRAPHCLVLEKYRTQEFSSHPRFTSIIDRGFC
jgi:hypothetical protein